MIRAADKSPRLAHRPLVSTLRYNYQGGFFVWPARLRGPPTGLYGICTSKLTDKSPTRGERVSIAPVSYVSITKRPSPRSAKAVLLRNSVRFSRICFGILPPAAPLGGGSSTCALRKVFPTTRRDCVSTPRRSRAPVRLGPPESFRQSSESRGSRHRASPCFAMAP